MMETDIVQLPSLQQHLMQWFMPWLDEFEDSDYYAKDAASNQIMFVRDTIAPMVRKKGFYCDIPEVKVVSPTRFKDHKDFTHTVKQTALVVGEHHSKSVRLPVYAFGRRDLGLTLVLRGNFHNWKLSVQSYLKPIANEAFPMLFITEPSLEPEYTGNHLSPVYFEGFPREWCFGYYSENKHQWSAEIWNRDALWTTIFLIMNELEDLEPHKYWTKEAHRAHLDAETEAQKKQAKRENDVRS